MNPNILTKELINFIEKLRAAGYNIWTTQYVAAQDLILGLAAQSKLPPELTELRTLLAPILCRSPKEQAEFNTHFVQWISQFETVKPTETQVPSLEIEPELQKIGKGTQLWKWAFNKWSFIVLFIATIIITYVYWPDITNLFQGETTPTPPEITPPETAPIDETAQPNTAPLETTQFSLLQDILSALLLLIFFLLLWYPWWQYSIPRFLVRKSTSIPSDIKQLFVKGIDDKLFQSVGLSRTGQQLRKHFSIPSTQLDIAATLKKTIEAVGWFTPVTGTILIRPEYLVLIDRTTFNDHQAQLINSLVNQIIAEEVFVTRYYFDADPRRCYPEQINLVPITLAELANSYPEHRLMIFSDGNGLINPITGEIVNWIEQFSVWTPRALFTLETPDQWGYREQILDEADFLIMPANEAGLTFLAEQINTGAWQPYPKPSDSFSTAFPEYLSERPRRWLERHAPDATVLTELLKQVRDFLGETGYYWFKACAVYPELRWQLTLYLGYQLKLVTEERLAKLARLPWFRYGYMPNWLRERLVNDLYEQKEVRTTLYKLFLTALSNEPLPDFHLEIAFNKKIARHLLLKWFKHTPKNSPLSDYVFLAFMADKLAIRLPNTLYNRLTKPSNQLKPSTISFRPFLLAALLFALFAVTYEQLKQNFSRLFEQVSKDDNYIPNKIAENNMLRGIEYMRLQQDDRALKLLKEAVKLDRHYAEAHNALAVFYERRLRDYEKAKQHYQMALALKPNGSDNHNNYGQFLCGRNRWEEAEKHFLKALENPLYKTPEIPLTNAGLCALRNKHPIKGETYLRQALQRLPNIPIALYYMAQLSYEQKRYMPAREYLQRYLEVAKHTPQTLWLGIRIERALNNRDTEASYALLLRKRFPDAVETLLLNQTEVSKREQDASEQPVYHIVEPSDTLSSIAVRYGQDYKKIARWNNISLPYALSVGQKLRVSPPAPDSDGIPDEDDVCPYNTSEEISKGVYQTGSRKGCPIDSDNDGVPDYLDDCPQNTSLEISKSVDSRGCPFNELDTKYLRELVQVIESVRDVQETAKEQFKSVLEKLSAVVYFDGGELRQKYDQLSMELEHTEFKAAAIRDRIYLVENVAKALFGKWKNELNKHSNEKMRQASRRKLAKTQLQYEKFIATMKRAKQKIEPVLTLFREQVMFLKHNLNAQAIASIQGEFTLVESNVASLIKKMEESIQEADTFIRSMTQE